MVAPHVKLKERNVKSHGKMTMTLSQNKPDNKKWGANFAQSNEKKTHRERNERAYIKSCLRTTISLRFNFSFFV